MTLTASALKAPWFLLFVKNRVKVTASVPTAGTAGRGGNEAICQSVGAAGDRTEPGHLFGRQTQGRFPQRHRCTLAEQAELFPAPWP